MRSGAITVGEALESGRDNFALLRLALALAVIVSHAYSAPTGLATSEPLYASTGYSLGSHAVHGFFAVSGFLVAMSYERQRTPWTFALARLLRVFPGVIVATLVTALVIGGLMTTLPFVRYVTEPGVWRFVFVTVTSFKSATTLPGVFGENPLPFPLATVWTLRYELFCYAGVLVCGLLGLHRRRWLAPVAIAALCAALVVLGARGPIEPGLEAALRLPLIFLTGSAIYLYRDRLPLDAGLVAVPMILAQGLAVFVVGMFLPPLYKPALFVMTAWLVISLALAPALVAPALEPKHDLSYGVYLYGWPVQQVLVALFPAASATLMIAPAVAISCAIALSSWLLVEKPALRLKAPRPREALAR